VIREALTDPSPGDLYSDYQLFDQWNTAKTLVRPEADKAERRNTHGPSATSTSIDYLAKSFILNRAHESIHHL
jgi:hypothetical protein